MLVRSNWSSEQWIYDATESSDKIYTKIDASEYRIADIRIVKLGVSQTEITDDCKQNNWKFVNKL